MISSVDLDRTAENCNCVTSFELYMYALLCGNLDGWKPFPLRDTVCFLWGPYTFKSFND